MLFGQGATVPETINWAQLVTSGGFAALVWYLIVVHLPRERQAFTDELGKERTSREKHEKVCEDERRAFLEEVRKLRQVIWRFGGERPSEGGE